MRFTRHFQAAMLSLIFLASCSKPSEKPSSTPPVSQTAPSPAAQSSSAARIKTSPLSEVTVRYESVKSDAVVVNGRSLLLAELPAQFPAEWRRLPPPTGAPFHGWTALKIQVDGPTPFSVIRRINDAAQAAGARHATLVVDGYDPSPPANPVETPLKIGFPNRDEKLPSEQPKRPQRRLVEVKAESRQDGKLASVGLKSFPLFPRSIRELNIYLDSNIRGPTFVGLERADLAIILDDKLRADELAKLIFACEYVSVRKDVYEPLASEVYFADPDSEVAPSFASIVPPEPGVLVAKPSSSAPSAIPSAPVVVEIAPSGSPVSQVVVQYESSRPDVIVVNGNSINLADFTAQFPGEWRRLSVQLANDPDRSDQFRIRVDAATPFATLRRIHDVARDSGVSRGKFELAEADAKILPMSDSDHSLYFGILPGERNSSDGPLNTQIEYHTLHLQAQADGRLGAVKIDDAPAAQADPIAAVEAFVRTRVDRARLTGEDEPWLALVGDDKLRAGDFARALFACQYRSEGVDPSGKPQWVRGARGGFLAPIPDYVKSAIQARFVAPEPSPPPPKRSALFGRPLDQSGVPQPVKTPPM